jgi:hypothetical protein
MAEAFLQLSTSDQREALEFASGVSGRPIHLLQKDVWVVWALETLCASAVGPHLVFKGGTSLSKAYGVIDRFSEDVDLTYDIRTLAPDLVADGVDGLPQPEVRKRSGQKRSRFAWPAGQTTLLYQLSNPRSSPPTYRRMLGWKRIGFISNMHLLRRERDMCDPRLCWSLAHARRANLGKNALSPAMLRPPYHN